MPSKSAYGKVKPEETAVPPETQTAHRSELVGEFLEFYNHCLEMWDLDPVATELLRTAAYARQKASHYEQLIARDGDLVANRFGELKPHPAATLAREQTTISNTALSRLMNVLEAEGQIGKGEAAPW